MKNNYHDNILETGIPLLNDKDEQIRNEINSGAIELFKTDKLGEKTLKVVQAGFLKFMAKSR